MVDQEFVNMPACFAMDRSTLRCATPDSGSEGEVDSEDLPLNISRDQCLLVCGEFVHTLLQSTLDRQ